MPPLYLRVCERLMLEANHQDNEIPYQGKKKLIKRGEKLTSIRKISEWVGWYERGIFKTPNPKTIKKILDWLIENKMLEIYDEGNRRETHYKVLNYEVYQGYDGDESNAKVTVGGHKQEGKELYTTTITTGQPEENIPVADMDADSVQQDPVLDEGADPSPCAIVEKHYAANVLNRAVVGSTDLKIIFDTCNLYPVDFILETMDITVKANKERNGKCTIKSFNYFMPVLEEAWKKRQFKSKPLKLIREKGNIHGFNKQSNRKSKYSEEQLRKFRAF